VDLGDDAAPDGLRLDGDAISPARAERVEQRELAVEAAVRSRGVLEPLHVVAEGGGEDVAPRRGPLGELRHRRARGLRRPEQVREPEPPQPSQSEDVRRGRPARDGTEEREPSREAARD